MNHVRRKTYNAVKKKLKETELRLEVTQQEMERLREEHAQCETQRVESLWAVRRLKITVTYLKLQLKNKEIDRLELLGRNRQLELAFNPMLLERDRLSNDLDRALDVNADLTVRLEQCGGAVNKPAKGEQIDTKQSQHGIKEMDNRAKVKLIGGP